MPRASHTRIEGERTGRLLVRVSAPPLEGRANEAACRLLAKALGVAPGRVEVTSGQHSRDKVIRVSGLAPEDVEARLRAQR